MYQKHTPGCHKPLFQGLDGAHFSDYPGNGFIVLEEQLAVL